MLKCRSTVDLLRLCIAVPPSSLVGQHNITGNSMSNFQIPNEDDLHRWLDIALIEHCDANSIDNDFGIREVLDDIHYGKESDSLWCKALMQSQPDMSNSDWETLAKTEGSGIMEMRFMANRWRVFRRQARMTVGEFREAFYSL